MINRLLTVESNFTLASQPAEEEYQCVYDMDTEASGGHLAGL